MKRIKKGEKKKTRRKNVLENTLETSSGDITTAKKEREREFKRSAHMVMREQGEKFEKPLGRE